MPAWSAPTSAGPSPADQVRCLITATLVPLGTVASQDGPAAPAGGRRCAVAAGDAIGGALLELSPASSLSAVTGLARRAAATGLRWSAGRLLIVVAGLACVTGFAAFWILRGEFRGW